MNHFSAHLATADDGACRIEFTGEFDFAGRELADQVLESAGRAPKLVLDLSGLDFIDSMGIHFVVTAHEQAKRDGRELTIVRGGPQVERVFSLVGLDEALPFATAA